MQVEFWHQCLQPSGGATADKFGIKLKNWGLVLNWMVHPILVEKKWNEFHCPCSYKYMYYNHEKAILNTVWEFFAEVETVCYNIYPHLSNGPESCSFTCQIIIITGKKRKEWNLGCGTLHHMLVNDVTDWVGDMCANFFGFTVCPLERLPEVEGI